MTDFSPPKAYCMDCGLVHERDVEACSRRARRGVKFSFTISDQRYKLIAEQRKAIEARKNLLAEVKILADIRLFADVHDLQLVVRRLHMGSDNFQASFKHCLVHRDGFLRAESGIGTSESDAVVRYGKQISSSWLCLALLDGTRRDILTWHFAPGDGRRS